MCPEFLRIIAATKSLWKTFMNVLDKSVNRFVKTAFYVSVGGNLGGLFFGKELYTDFFWIMGRFVSEVTKTAAYTSERISWKNVLKDSFFMFFFGLWAEKAWSRGAEFSRKNFFPRTLGQKMTARFRLKCIILHVQRSHFRENWKKLQVENSPVTSSCKLSAVL